MNLWTAESEVNRKFEAVFVFAFPTHSRPDPSPGARGHSPDRAEMWGKETKSLRYLLLGCVDCCGELEEMERETGFEPATLSLEG